MADVLEPQMGFGPGVERLIAWLVLHQLWKTKTVNFRKTFHATLVLVALGVVGTFPTFFELFH